MGSKSVHAPAVQVARVRSVRPSAVRPRTWHPVVYLADRGPVRFAPCATMREAFDQARSLAESLGARTWSAVPGRASVLSNEGGRDE
jgi:hypothetical protein